MSEFIECDTCRAKSGSPALCEGCYQNRKTIYGLQRKIANAMEITEGSYFSKYNMVEDIKKALKGE